MEFKEVIYKRHTIRDFSDDGIKKEDIIEAITDAFQAPSYNHLKQWDFVLVDDMNTKLALTETETMHDEISDEIKSLFKDHDPIAKEMYLDAIPKQKKMILEAPYVLVAIYKPKTEISRIKKIYDLNGFASIWCAIENLLLSLAEKNIFGVTFIPKNTIGVKKVLNIPTDLEVASIIPIGYKKKDAKRIKSKEINIREHIKYNNWE